MTAARQYPAMPPDPQELAAEIADTRAALGETVSALAAKADVKARLSDRMSGIKARTTEVRRNAVAEVAGAAEDFGSMARNAAHSARRNPLPLLATAAGAAVVIFLVARGRKR